jgi:hypothetical protein
MSKSHISDATGVHALEHVIAITPIVGKAPAGGGTAPPPRARLHMIGGQCFHTDTDYSAALEAWGAEPPPPAESK